MSRRSLALLLYGAVIGVWITGNSLALSRPGNVDPFRLSAFLWGSMVLTFPSVGVVVARKQPANPIGWLFLVGPLMAMTGVALAEVVNIQQGGASPWVGYGSDVFFFTGVGLMAGFFLILFPSGRPPSHRWRYAVWAGVAGVVIEAAWAMVRPCSVYVLVNVTGRPDPSCADAVAPWFVRVPNPLGWSLPGGAGLWAVVGAAGWILAIGSFLLGAMSLFVRFRRALGSERAQLKWPLAVLAMVIPMGSAILMLDLMFDVQFAPFGVVFLVLVFVGLPTSIGLAIVRYRLFDVDRLISRTVTFSIVALVLGAVYAVAATLPLLMIGRPADTPSWLVAASTLATAALFSPLRRRVQRAMDRRFNRSRYDAEGVMQHFSQQVRHSTDVAEITSGVAGVLQGALHPARVAVWLREVGP